MELRLIIYRTIRKRKLKNKGLKIYRSVKSDFL